MTLLNSNEAMINDEKDKIEGGMFHYADPRLFEYATKNRHNPTLAEAQLWQGLCNKQLGGYKFRRQHPMGSYIADFYCHAKKIVIEIDGGYHTTPEQFTIDKERTKQFESVGVRLLRFKNEDVLDDYCGVMERIWQVLDGDK